MPVKKDPSGRRSVQVEVEVPGTPEEVWQAIATGPGISAWFVPTEVVERDGKPVEIKDNFGPGMESVASVTAWDPPRRYAAESPGWGPNMPPMATEWQRRSPRRRHLHRPRRARAFLPAPMNGMISSRAPNPAGPASSASCGCTSLISAASAARRSS